MYIRLIYYSASSRDMNQPMFDNQHAATLQCGTNTDSGSRVTAQTPLFLDPKEGATSHVGMATLQAWGGTMGHPCQPCAVSGTHVQPPDQSASPAPPLCAKTVQRHDHVPVLIGTRQQHDKVRGQNPQLSVAKGGGVGLLGTSDTKKGEQSNGHGQGEVELTKDTDEMRAIETYPDGGAAHDHVTVGSETGTPGLHHPRTLDPAEQVIPQLIPGQLMGGPLIPGQPGPPG